MKDITNEIDLQDYINKDLKNYNLINYHRKSSRGGHRITANRFKLNGKWLAYPDNQISINPGRTVYMELKWGYNKLSEEQENFCFWAIQNKFHFYTVKSVAEYELMKKIENIT